MPALRYVVLHHTEIDEPHYDLMLELESDSELSTWRLPHWPPAPGDIFTPLPKHRRSYLEYEGPVSGNRGSVKRITSGNYQIVEKTAAELTIAVANNLIIKLPTTPN